VSHFEEAVAKYRNDVISTL